MTVSSSFSSLRRVCLMGSCLVLLSGCGWLQNWPPGNENSSLQSAQQASKAAPPPNVAQMPGGSWVNETSNAMASPKGLGVDADSAQRIAALEMEISNLRNEINLIMPALTKLASSQGDLHAAVTNIEPAAGRLVSSGVTAGHNMQGNFATYDPNIHDKMIQQQNQQQNHQQAMNNPVNLAPPAPQGMNVANSMAAQAPAYQQASIPHSSTNQQQMNQPQAVAMAANIPSRHVRNVRFGEHADKTRLVLDTNDEVAFRYNVDNNENIVVIDLPNADWQGARDMMINAPLVSSYRVVPREQGGQKMIMQMSRPVQVLWAQALPPGGPQGHRVVFDIAPL